MKEANVSNINWVALSEIVRNSDYTFHSLSQLLSVDLSSKKDKGEGIPKGQWDILKAILNFDDEDVLIKNVTDSGMPAQGSLDTAALDPVLKHYFNDNMLDRAKHTREEISALDKATKSLKESHKTAADRLEDTMKSVSRHIVEAIVANASCTKEMNDSLSIVSNQLDLLKKDISGLKELLEEIVTRPGMSTEVSSVQTQVPLDDVSTEPVQTVMEDVASIDKSGGDRDAVMLKELGTLLDKLLDDNGGEVIEEEYYRKAFDLGYSRMQAVQTRKRIGKYKQRTVGSNPKKYYIYNGEKDDKE